MSLHFAEEEFESREHKVNKIYERKKILMHYYCFVKSRCIG